MLPLRPWARNPQPAARAFCTQSASIMPPTTYRCPSTVSSETGVVRIWPLLRPGTERICMVPSANPMLCNRMTMRLAAFSHRGTNLRFRPYSPSSCHIFSFTPAGAVVLQWGLACGDTHRDYFYDKKFPMSKEDRQELIASVAWEIAEFQDAGSLVDEAIAQHMGINRTDQRCLGLLSFNGPMGAGQLAAATELSPVR